MNRALLCLCLLAAAGCGPSSPPGASSAAGATGAPGQPAVPGAVTATAEEPGVGIVWWTVPELAPARDGAEPWALDAALAAFRQAHPEIRVTVAVRPANGAGGIVDYLLAAARVAPGALPDLVTLPLESVSTEGVAGLLSAVWGDASGGASPSLFPFAAASVTDAKGAPIALPFALDVAHLVSRKAAPASWSDLGASGRWVVPYPAPDCRALSPVLALNAGVGGQAGALEHVDTALFQPALDFLGQAARAGEVEAAPDGADVATGAWSRFLDTKAAGVALGGGTFVRFQSSFPAFTWGPPSDAVSAGNAVGCGWAFAVTAREPARLLPAAALARWLAAPQQGHWVVAAGYLPARRDQLATLVERGVDRGPSADYLLYLQSLLETAVPVRGADQWQQSLASAYDSTLHAATASAGTATSP